MEYYDNMHVFDTVPIDQCWERTGKAPLKARWVDIDKGTGYRFRWAAKQFKGSDSEECFAATPPIEALRALISYTMSGPKEKALMVCDVSRAFFYAPVQHEIYVELCEEAKKTVVDNNMCAKLRMSILWDQGLRSKLAKESSRNDGHTRFLNWQGFTRSVLSSPGEFEMCSARRRLRCVRKTSGTCLDAKRVEVPAGNQHHNTWRRTRNVRRS